MEAKHTPGPWKFLPSFGRVEVEKFIVAYLSLSVEGRTNPIYLSQGEAEANGRLIAAAPELLEALDKIRNLERRNFREAWDMLQEVDRLAGAAIRKAKGE